MEFIIGGCFQGKSEFARKRYQEKTGQVLSVEEWFQLSADGRHSSWEEAWNVPVIEHTEQYIKRLSKEEGSMAEKQQRIATWIETLMDKNRDVIVLMDEVGCGIVPMQREEREYRDLVGFAGQRIAKKAERVYRIQVGIGSIIQ